MLRIIEKHLIEQKETSALGVGKIIPTPKYKCLVVDINDENKQEFEVTLIEEEVELIEMLNSIQKGANLYAPIMNELWDKIQRFAQKRYKDGKMAGKFAC